MSQRVNPDLKKDLVKYGIQDWNECFHCGNCTAVCFAGALTMHPKNWELQFNKEECIVCELCVKACPMNLFEIDFHDSN